MAAVETEARDYRCPIVIRIDEELRDAIRERAREEDRSIASLIRTALRGYVNGR